MRFVNDVMQMRMVKNLIIKRKSELYLQPGGKHIMLMGLKKLLMVKILVLNFALIMKS